MDRRIQRCVRQVFGLVEQRAHMGAHQANAGNGRGQGQAMHDGAEQGGRGQVARDHDAHHVHGIETRGDEPAHVTKLKGARLGSDRSAVAVSHRGRGVDQ
ncbi:hypothetical protein D3C72_1213780 [compost metagenome]